MRVLQNIKIGTRMALSYLLILLFMVILAVTMSFCLKKVSRDSEVMVEKDILPLELLNDLSIDTHQLTASIANAAMFGADEDLMAEYVQQYDYYKNKILGDMAEYKQLLLDYKGNMVLFQEMEDLYENEFIPKLDGAMAFALDKVQPDDLGLFIKLNVMPAANHFSSFIEELYDTHTLAAGITAAQNAKFANRVLTAATFLIIVVLLLAIMVVYFVTSSITKPVRRIVLATNEIAKGNLNVNLPAATKDELGMLTGAFSKMKNTLDQLIHEMDSMSQNQAKGITTAFIDEQAFSGQYKDIALGINEMTKARLNVTRQIITCIRQMGEGNFDADLAQFPGDLSVFNTAMEDLRQDLKTVHVKISSLVYQALEGNLKARIETEALMGDWKKLAQEINQLLDNITKPLYEALEVLDEFSKGNLSIQMTKEYQGDYKWIKDTINGTTSTINSYMTEITETLNQMAFQNLDISISRVYIGDFEPVKQAINHIIQNFNAILGSINAASMAVAEGAKQISETSIGLAQGAEEQDRSVTALTESLAQVMQMAEATNKAAENSKNITQETKAYAEQGSQEMKELLSVMAEINESSKYISKITGIIQDIAMQTNLLALNASVEAARAGAHGRGFAVVANEVQNLAAKSQKAGGDITKVLDNSKALFRTGNVAAKRTSQTFQKIIDDVSDMSGAMVEIASASKEQQTKLEMVNDHVLQISAITQQMGGNSNEGAASSQSLSAQSNALKSMVQQFVLMDKEEQGEK